MVVFALLCLCLFTGGRASVGSATPIPNMNGDYVIANSDKFPTNMMSYPGGVESFDAYHGPIQTVYSEVWWTTAQDALPREIVDRFDNKVMAIVGIEMDQVRRTPEGDVSVPINMAYNHHHNTMVIGKGASMERVPIDDSRVVAAQGKWAPLSGGTHVWLPVEHTPSTSGSATSAMFDDGNGGEFRKSIHVYAPPFAQLVESPTEISGIAMQIDTWNRDSMNISGSPFVPGPVPKHNLAPLTGPDAIYSGLLECPLTTRIEKIFDGSPGFNSSFKAETFSCGGPANGFCVEDNVNGISGDVPVPGGNGSGVTFAGLLDSADGCEALCNASAACTSFTWVSSAFSQPAWRRMCYLRTSGPSATAAMTGIVTGWRGACGGGGVQPTTRCEHGVTSADDCFAAVSGLAGLANATITRRVVDDPKLPPGCTVVVDPKTLRASVAYNTLNASDACCGLGPASTVAGSTTSLGGAVALDLNVSGATGRVLLTLSGPASVWYGVGFDAALMSDAPYSIIVDGAGNVSERRLANHAAGTLLPPSLEVVSNTVAGGVRTVVLSRPLAAPTSGSYSFDPTALTLNFIAAVGQTAAFGPHNAAPHGADTVRLWPSTPVCVCAVPATPFGQGSGKIKYLPTGETVGFAPNRCPPQPRGDLLAQRNPTCDLRTYVGGLATCHHGWMLLDAEQDVPWESQPLVYYKKFRVYFQEYKPAEHVQIVRMDWGIGAGGNHDEYDVPQCAPGTPTAECTHVVTGTWAPISESQPEAHLVALHHHCHAPTCLLVETFNNDTGELLCRTAPVYGGTGGYVADKPEFDEAGYIATPPCMWGKPEDGLTPPPRMNGVTIRVVATTNSTYGHHGEMALPQAMIAWGPLNASAFG